MVTYTYLGIKEYRSLTTLALLAAEAEHLPLLHPFCIEEFKNFACSAAELRASLGRR